MEEKDNTISTTTTTTKTNESKEEENDDKNINKENENNEDEQIVNRLKNLDIETKDLLSLINELIDFSFKIKSIKNIGILLTNENIEVLKKLVSKENIKINLILTKIYMNIMDNESLYSKYLLVLNDDNTSLLLRIIEECISLIEKLNNFVFDQEQFQFKIQTFSFIKCLYYNFKNKITNEVSLRKLMDWIDSFPAQFFSETYNELNREKDLMDIWKVQDVDKISTFEDRFAQINNYYEQFDIFCKFVETNSGVVKYDSIKGEEGNPEEEKKEEEKNELDPSKIDFYHQYGLLILKFCKYHHYVFLDKENKDADKKKKEGEEENENVRVVFLLDKIKQLDDEENKEEENEEKKEEQNEEKKEEENKEETKKDEEKKETENGEETKKEGEEKKEEVNKEEGNQNEKEKGNKKIKGVMNEKLFLSIVDSKEYNEFIKKEINNYLNATKSLAEEEKLKTIREEMSYFLSILDTDSYVPLYLSDFSKITISDNFTPSFLTNVPAGKINELYIETKMNETMLVFIEFSLEDKSKDITFEVNKYEISSNSFKLIYKEERIEDTFKFFILCKGYSLYQILFNNYYSWFTSKDINYRIGVLKLKKKKKKDLDFGQNDEAKKEENKDEEKTEKTEEKKEEEKEAKKEDKKEENVEDKLYCYFNGKNVYFNIKEISQKIKDLDNKKEEDIINIPVLLYLNNLRIIYFENGEIKFKEKIEEDENYIPKHLFDYSIIDYIKKTYKNEAKKKKIIISIFSLNRDLSTFYKEIDEQIKALNVPSINNSINDYETSEYLQKIGFYPSEILKGYNVKFKLYDLCEQSLIYHLYLSNLKNKVPKKSVLLMQFDKCVVNAAVFNEGAIFTKLKGKKEKGANWKSSYFNNINISDINAIFDFLENANDTFEGIELVLSYVDQNEEKQKQLNELFGKIEKHCREKINPPVKVIIYKQNEMANNVFNYINLFYDN